MACNMCTPSIDPCTVNNCMVRNNLQFCIPECKKRKRYLEHLSVMKNNFCPYCGRKLKRTKTDVETKEFKIDGTIETPIDVTEDFINDAFIKFIEDHKWYFGGGINEYER